MKIIRNTLLVLLFLLAAGVGVLLWFFLTADPSDLFKTLSHELNRAYGIELRAEKVQWKLLEGLSVSNLSVSAGGGFSNGTAATAITASLFYNPATLPARRLDVLRMNISGADIRLPSLLSLIAHFQKNALKTKPVDSKPLFTLSLGPIELRDSRFTINGLSLKLKCDINPDNRSLTNLFSWFYRAELNSEKGRVSWKGTLDRADLSIDDADLAAFFPGSPEIRFANIEGAMIRTKSLYRLLGRSFSMRWNSWDIAVSSGFTAVLDIGGKHIEAGNARVTLNSNTTATLSQLNLDLASKKVELDIGGVNLPLGSYLPGVTGTLSGDFHAAYRGKLFVSGRGKVSALRWRFIRDASADFTLRDNAVESQFQADSAGGSASGSVKGADFFVSPFDVVLKAGEIDLAPVISNLRSSSVAAAPAKEGGSYRLPPVRFMVDSPRVRWGKAAFAPVKLTGVYSAVIWEVNSAEGYAWRGKFTAKGKLEKGVFSGTAWAKEVRLKDLAQEFLEFPRTLFGTLDLNAEFNIPTAKPGEAVADFSITARNGQFRDFVMQEKLGAFLFEMPLDRIDFDAVTCSGSWRAGRLTADSFRFDSSDIRASGNGSFDTAGGELAADIGFSFSREYAAGLPNVAQLITSGLEKNGRVEIRVGASGSWKKPLFRIMK